MSLQPAPGGAAEWFVAQVRAGREHLTARHLRMRGYEVFLPCYTERRRWSDRIRTRERPLFDGYLFCRLSGSVVGKIVTTPGVMRIVGEGGRAVPVPGHEIETIRRIVAERLPCEPWQYLQVGERVSIECGPLRGIRGVVVKSGNTGRIVVSISLLRRAIAVDVDATWLRASSPTSAFPIGNP
jgi:transcription antitermination factor NusG